MVTVPLRAYEQVPVGPLAGKTVVDTNNYYPDRDGRIAALDDGSATTSGLLAAHLAGAHIVKTFSNIFFRALAELPRPASAEDRSCLPVWADDPAAIAEVGGFLDDIGYDSFLAGPLSESWRAENGQPAYVYPYTTGHDVNHPVAANESSLRESLSRADRDSADPRTATSPR